jgi:hypothetical protein
LKVQGACASVISPTTRMSTPMSRIQSGMATQTSPRGRPDANDWRTTAAVRLDRIASARLARAPPPGLGRVWCIKVTITLLVGTTRGVQHASSPGAGEPKR